jgi:hypothetical protein
MNADALLLDGEGKWSYGLSKQLELEDQNTHRDSGGVGNFSSPWSSQLWRWGRR